MQKTIMVTGATSGIGKETAHELAIRGAQIIVAGRNKDKAEATTTWIREDTGNDRVDYLLADFASLEDVRRLADQFTQRYDRLDVLVNNAGAMFFRRKESVDGYEMTFAVNHLAPFLLTNLLLATLRTSAPARVVTVASDSHNGATLEVDNLQFEKSYSGMKAYGRSKLANILFSYELARRLEGSTVTSNAMHPGFVSTGMGSNNLPSWLAGLLPRITSPFAREVTEGADTIVYLADSSQVEGVSGKYFMDREPIRSSPLTYDEALARQLWQISARMVGLSQTEVS